MELGISDIRVDVGVDVRTWARGLDLEMGELLYPLPTMHIILFKNFYCIIANHSPNNTCSFIFYFKCGFQQHRPDKKIF